MKANEKISVIVPVYNVKLYLHKCVDSILNQTYQNIEVLLIDDGSTDGSSDICDSYTEKDSRIKVVHKKWWVEQCKEYRIGYGNGGVYFICGQ